MARRTVLARLPLPLAFSLTAMLAACSGGPAPAPAAKPVVVERLTPTNTTPAEQYSGAVHARYQSALAFRIGGKVVARYVTLGESVRRGQVLARLDGTDAALEKDAAEAALAAAKSNLDTATRDHSRYGGLIRSGAVSRSAYDHQRDEVAGAQAQYRQAEREYQLRDRQLRYSELRADHDGVITAVDAEVGQVVAQGETVLSLAWSDGRDVYIDVPESRIAEFTGSKQITVSLWQQHRIYRGTIREKAASADPATRTFLLKIAITQPGPDVRLGMTANVTVADASDPRELVIPTTALYHEGSAPAVWVVDPATQKLKITPVGIRRYTDRGVVIGSGLSAGAEVVIKGVNELYQGEAVRITAPVGDDAV